MSGTNRKLGDLGNWRLLCRSQGLLGPRADLPFFRSVRTSCRSPDWPWGRAAPLGAVLLQALVTQLAVAEQILEDGEGALAAGAKLRVEMFDRLDPLPQRPLVCAGHDVALRRCVCKRLSLNVWGVSSLRAPPSLEEGAEILLACNRVRFASSGPRGTTSLMVAICWAMAGDSAVALAAAYAIRVYQPSLRGCNGNLPCLPYGRPADP
jgi:hypothetical protein